MSVMKFTQIISTFLIFTIVFDVHRKIVAGKIEEDHNDAIRDIVPSRIKEENHDLMDGSSNKDQIGGISDIKIKDIMNENYRISSNSREKIMKNKNENLLPFNLQVAGNRGEKKGKKFGMSKDADGNVWKASPTEMEENFYLNLNEASESDLILNELRQFVPKFCGLKTTKTGDRETKYLCIEDITGNFFLPNVMDVKIGEQTWGPGEDEEKVQKRKSKFVKMREHYGFSIIGTRYYKFRTGRPETYSRPLTDNMTLEEGITVLYKFVNGRSGLKYGLVTKILVQLMAIRSWFERQRRYNFYGSSILIAYDSLSLKSDPRVHVRMIDFSQAIPSTNKDENYARGLGNLIKVFENLRTAVRRYTNMPRIKETSQATITLDAERSRLRSTSTYVFAPADIMKPTFNYLAYNDNVDLLAHTLRRNTLGLLFLTSNIFNESIPVKRDTHNNADFVRVFYKPDLNMEEGYFYKIMTITRDPFLLEFRQFIPAYYGKIQLKVKNEVLIALRLENFMNGVDLPCFTYVEIGSRRKPEWAPPQSGEEQFEFSKNLDERNFDIHEVRYHSVELLKVKKDPFWRKVLKSDPSIQPDEALYNFVNGEIGIECGVVDNFLYQLRRLESWFERQRYFRFYQTTLVLLYDAKTLHEFLADPLKFRSFNDPRISDVPVKVLVVDFDNVFIDTEDKPDENCLSALRNLILVFENMSRYIPR